MEYPCYYCVWGFKCAKSGVEHVFGFMEQSMNKLYVRSIGMQRASGFVGLVNLTYNLFRYEQVVRLDGISVSDWQ